MYWALIILHVFVCAFLILVVLLQAGRGGGMGIAFGGGGSQTVFGGSGAGNFLTRLTAICAVVFFANSLALAYLSSQSDSKRLQELADKKAAAKKTEDAAKSKALGDLEKAREAIEKATGKPTDLPAGAAAPAAGTGAAATTTPGQATSKPAEGAAAPATTPAPAAETKPAEAAKPATKPEATKPPAPAAKKAPEGAAAPAAEPTPAQPAAPATPQTP